MPRTCMFTHVFTIKFANIHTHAVLFTKNGSILHLLFSYFVRRLNSATHKIKCHNARAIEHQYKKRLNSTHPVYMVSV